MARGEETEETHRRGHQRGDGCVCVCACVRASERRRVCVCVLGEESRLENECQVITPLKASSDPLGVRSWAKCWYLK